MLQFIPSVGWIWRYFSLELSWESKAQEENRNPKSKTTNNSETNKQNPKYQQSCSLAWLLLLENKIE